MGQRGNELCLCLFILADLHGHFIDRFSQFTDFEIILFGDLNTVAAACDHPCFLGDLDDWLLHGLNVPIDCQQKDGDHYQNNCQRQNCHVNNLLVHCFCLRNEAQNTDHFSVCGNQRSGNCHNMSSILRISSHKGTYTPAADCLPDFCGFLHCRIPLSFRGRNHKAIGIYKLQF